MLFAGGKITRSASEVKVLEPSGNLVSFHESESPRISPTAQLMLEHFRKCLKHCQALEETLSVVAETTEEACFPVIVGRRPQNNNVQKSTLREGNKENVPFQSAVNVPTVRNSNFLALIDFAMSILIMNYACCIADSGL